MSASYEILRNFGQLVLAVICLASIQAPVRQGRWRCRLISSRYRKAIAGVVATIARPEANVGRNMQGRHVIGYTVPSRASPPSSEAGTVDFV